MMKWFGQLVMFGAIMAIPAMAFSFAGYAAGKPKASAESASKKDAGASAAEMMPQIDPNLPTVTGKVFETMNAGGYTYINLESNDGSLKWYAVPQSEVKVGQEIELTKGTEMGSFKSKALNRTFDSINFSSGIVVRDDKETLKRAHQDVMKGSGEAAKEAPIKVEKAAGDNACTVGDAHLKKAELNGKKIAVKGKVVKYSSGIMGKNWIHLRDGSGDGDKGTNDLILTTQDAAKVGDVVTATGILSVDKDFGSGYKYDVIIEDASVKQ